LEELLGVTVLGSLPYLGGWRWRHHPEHWVLRAPWSEYSEALRRAYIELTLIGLGGRPRTVAFTSALPGDGKTSTLLALGRLLSETGRRVVAVDLNLRKPTLHRAAKLNVDIGLGEWYDRNLDFRANAKALVYKDPASRLRLIPAGKLTADPGVLLHSQRFAELLAGLWSDFDVVLLDTSPVLAVVDAQIVSALADVTILLVRAGRTPKRSVGEAFALLSRATGVVPQVVFNAADRSEVVPTRGHGLGAYYLIEPGAAASAARQLPGGTGDAGSGSMSAGG
jgi:capsular exopolysaccharide synthesis family protein